MGPFKKIKHKKDWYLKIKVFKTYLSHKKHCDFWVCDYEKRKHQLTDSKDEENSKKFDHRNLKKNELFSPIWSNAQVYLSGKTVAKVSNLCWVGSVKKPSPSTLPYVSFSDKMHTI